MKIKVNKDRLAEAVNTVKDVVSDNGLEIIKNVKMETVGADKVRVTATNLDLTITSEVPCEVAEEGATTVRARLLSQIVGSLPAGAQVDFSSSGRASEQAMLVGGEAKFRISTLPVSEFPEMKSIDGLEMEFDAADLRGLLRRTAYAACAEDDRRILMAVCFQAKDGVVTAVATDGRRLSAASLEKADDVVGKDFEMLLPTASVRCLLRMLSGGGKVKLSLDPGKQASFSSDGWALQTRLVDGVYPNWRHVVPSGEMKSVVIGRNDFMEAVKQASATASTVNTSVAISIFDGYIGLKSKNGDGTADSSVKVVAKSSGDGVSILLSPKYLLDALGAIPCDSVNFNYARADAPVTFREDGEDAVAVLMPLRVG